MNAWFDSWIVLSTIWFWGQWLQLNAIWIWKKKCYLNQSLGVLMAWVCRHFEWEWRLLLHEPRHKRTCLRGFRPGKTQSGLLSYRSFEISDLETGDIILSRQRTTTMLIRLCRCAGSSVSFLFVYGWQKQVFSWRGSIGRIILSCRSCSFGLSLWLSLFCWLSINVVQLENHFKVKKKHLIIIHYYLQFMNYIDFHLLYGYFTFSNTMYLSVW